MVPHARSTATFCQMRETIRRCAAGGPLSEGQRAALSSGRLQGVVSD